MNKIIKGDALTKLKELESESVNCIMTSPPYWALRDYGIEGQLGLEPTFEEYVNKLCNIFDEVKRVLRKDGTCWVNLGDTYNANYRGSSEPNEWHKQKRSKGEIEFMGKKPMDKGGLPSKCLTLIPMRFAIEMVNRGWILRNVIIWHKPNCMPSSVKDRFTVDFEYIFFFSKKKKYYFETQYEPYSEETIKDSRFNPGTKDHHSYNWKADGVDDDLSIKVQRGGFKQGSEKGRNKRAVWQICPKPFKEAHFAVYPEELCETPIKAGCPEFVCVKCGNAKVMEVDTKYKNDDGKFVEPEKFSSGGLEKGAWGNKKSHFHAIRNNLGYKPTCKCNAGFTSGTVLDPFLGSGTTGLVALKQNKKFIGIELNEEYIEIAKKRLKPFLEQRKLI